MKSILFISKLDEEKVRNKNIFELLAQIPNQMLPSLGTDVYIKICHLHKERGEEGEYYIQYEELVQINQKVRREEIYFDVIIFYDIDRFLLNQEEDLVDFREEYEFFTNPQNWIAFNTETEDNEEFSGLPVYNCPVILFYDTQKNIWSWAGNYEENFS